MTDLLVDRLHARAAVASAADEARVHALLTALTGRRLDEALATAALPDGHWCLRRLAVSLPLDPTADDGALARRWARTVTDTLVAALSDAGPDVAYYPRRTDAVLDLVAALAVGDPARQWAWRAAGVLADTDPDPAGEPAEAVLAVLGRHPAGAVHTLSAAAARVGLPAVHRLLGPDGWRRAAALVLDASGSSPGRWLAGDSPAMERAAATRAIVAGILARSPFVAAWRRSRLRPTAGTARAWAVLAAAEAEPALLRRPDAAVVLSLLPTAVDPATAPARDGATAGPAPLAAGLPAVSTDETRPYAPGAADLGPVEPGRGRRDPDGGAPVPTEPGRVEDADGPATGPVTDRPGAGRPPAADSRPAGRHTPPPEPEPAPTAVPTAWGGLAYLLATADAAGIPDALFADPDLGTRPAPWLLFHLARLLVGESADSLTDPAVRAVAGLRSGDEPPAPPPGPRQRAALDRHADRWARVTAERMAAGRDGPRALVARIAARAGTVESVPGWVEIRLRLADVDLAVRRAGLDLDPGFVPWLGAVVVIRYE